MIDYSIIVKNADGDALGQFAAFRNLTLGKKLNNYGTCSFDIPMTDPKINSLIALRQYTIEVYRNSTLLWAGEQAIRKKSKKSTGDNWASIYCYDWLEQLNSRFTDETRTFTNVDAGQIAWTLIAETQVESSLGITQGTIEATMNRDRTYNNQNIMEALINLSNVINGFDFEINNSKVFNVKSVIGVDRSNLIFEYGVNVSEYDLTDDFSQPVNRAIVIGDSGVVSDPLRVDRDDTGSQALIGLRESLDNEMTVSETGTLNDKGDAITRKYGQALRKIENMKLVKSSSPSIADFALGDIITFKDDEEDINDQFRVFGWDITVGTDNSELLNLILGDFTLGETG